MLTQDDQETHYRRHSFTHHNFVQSIALDDQRCIPLFLNGNLPSTVSHNLRFKRCRPTVNTPTERTYVNDSGKCVEYVGILKILVFLHRVTLIIRGLHVITKHFASAKPLSKINGTAVKWKTAGGIDMTFFRTSWHPSGPGAKFWTDEDFRQLIHRYIDEYHVKYPPLDNDKTTLTTNNVRNRRGTRKLLLNWLRLA